MVLVKPPTIEHVKDKDTPGVDIDQDVLKLLRHLPSYKTKEEENPVPAVTRLTATCPEYILMVVNRVLETLPVNRIALAILKDKNALSDVVKFKPIKPLEDEGKKKFEKAIFDSRISIRKKELFSDIGKTICLFKITPQDGDCLNIQLNLH